MDFATRSVRLPDLGIDFEVLAADSVIGPGIERGRYEQHETRLFRAHLEPGCLVVDLGANVGWYAVQAVAHGARVEAFEPVPEIAAICRRNVERAERLGRGSGRVHVLAAADREGRATIALGGENRGDNRVLPAGGGEPPEDMRGARTVDIELARVDQHVSGPARVLKIDTQGSEWLALAGCRELLAASPRLALLLEFWPYALRGAQPADLLAFLRAEGFRLGKATAAPYPMSSARILRQALARDPVRGGLDLYGVRGAPFHVLGPAARLHGVWRSLREA